MGHYRSEMVDVEAERRAEEDIKDRKRKAIQKRIDEVGIATVLMEIMDYNNHTIYLPFPWRE